MCNNLVMDEVEKYRKAIADGLKENKSLVEQKKALELRIRKIQELVSANINMIPDEKEAQKFREALDDAQGPTGLKDAILRVLKPNMIVHPPALRLLLSKSGYDFSGHVNPLSSIHTTLKRLVDADEIEAIQKDGRTSYKRKIKPAKTLTISY